MPDSFEEFWRKLQEAEPLLINEYLQADPVVVGRLCSDGHQVRIISAGRVGDDEIPELVVNGRLITIVFEADRGRSDTAPYSFQVELTEITSGSVSIYVKRNAWDNWKAPKITASGNKVSTEYDIENGTLVRGIVSGSTISQPNQPSRRLVEAHFAVRLVRDPKCMALGTFTIPVMPIALKYAPPQPQDSRRNTINYRIEQGSATTVKISVADEEQRTIPEGGGGAPDLGALFSKAQAAGGYVGAAAGILANLWGSFSSEVKAGFGVSSGSTSTVATSQAGSITLGEEGEKLGLGDVIEIQLNARFAWVSEDLENIKLVPLGAARRAAWPIQALLYDADILRRTQPAASSTPSSTTTSATTSGDPEFPPTTISDEETQHSLGGTTTAYDEETTWSLAGAPTALQTDLSYECIQALLGLDPMISAGLNIERLQQEPRLVRCRFSDEYGLVDEIQLTMDETRRFDVCATNTTSRADIKFKSKVEQYTPSLLEKWFSSPSMYSPTGSTYFKSSMSISSSHETTDWQIREVTISWVAEPRMVLQCFYDTVFSTYLFIKKEGAKLLEGVASDNLGHPMRGEWVIFTIAGHSVAARTDRSGRYTIYSSTKHRGRAELKIWGRRHFVNAFLGISCVLLLL